MNDDLELIHGSGNTFRDFGRRNASVEQARAILAAKIIRTLDERGLSTREAERLTGVAHSEFSRIRNARLGRFTLDRMITTLDDFLHKEGIYQAAKVEAVTRVISWQIAEEMRKRGITKTQMAEQMLTSRAQLDRILKAKGNVNIETPQRAAALVGRELHLELV